MAPLYTHCPHCSFPAVIAAPDRSMSRYCRQCRQVYAPEHGLREGNHAEEKSHLKTHRRRIALRSLLRRRPRTPISRGPE